MFVPLRNLANFQVPPSSRRGYLQIGEFELEAEESQDHGQDVAGLGDIVIVLVVNNRLVLNFGILLVTAGIALAVAVVVQAVDGNELTALAVNVVSAVVVGSDTSFVSALVGILHVAAGVALAVAVVVQAGNGNEVTALAVDLVRAITVGGDASFEGALVSGLDSTAIAGAHQGVVVSLSAQDGQAVTADHVVVSALVDQALPLVLADSATSADAVGSVLVSLGAQDFLAVAADNIVVSTVVDNALPLVVALGSNVECAASAGTVHELVGLGAQNGQAVTADDAVVCAVGGNALPLVAACGLFGLLGSSCRSLAPEALVTDERMGLLAAALCVAAVSANNGAASAIRLEARNPLMLMGISHRGHRYHADDHCQSHQHSKNTLIHYGNVTS